MKNKYENSQKNFEGAKLVLEEEFNFKYNEENLDSLRKNKRIERQNTGTNLFSNLNLDQSMDSERSKNIDFINSFKESSIIKEKDIQYICSLFTKNSPTNFSLVYKMSKHGENNNEFHSKCDNVVPILCFCKIRKNDKSESYNRFGGFIFKNWDTSNKIKNDESSFIFSLTRKKVFKIKFPYNSIYCSDKYGIVFGCQNIRNSLGLWTNRRKGGYDYINSYGDEERDCTCGLKEFTIDEMEGIIIIV